MSKATKFKYVAKEVLEEYPEPDAEHPIMKVIGSAGNNLHEVESPKGDRALVQMPAKFRKNVWIKKGDFVIIEWIENITKVQGDIVYILYADQIKHLRQNNLWPAEFDSDGDRAEKSARDEEAASHATREITQEVESSDSDADGEVFVNRNRQQQYMESASDSGSESDIEDAGELTEGSVSGIPAD